MSRFLRREVVWRLSLLLIATSLSIPAIPARASGSGIWIVTCQLSHQFPDDPIVFPGVPGASHLHTFYGSRDTNASSTPDSLRAAGTSCAMPGDTSGYWIPAVYARGQQLAPGTTRHALFYYRRVAAPVGTTVQTIPDGLRVIVGNSHAANPAENPKLGSQIAWKCGPDAGANLPQPPTQCSSGIMVLIVRTPNCWDGMNLDSPEHASHMAYPSSNRCPASHPVVLPMVESFFRFKVGTAPIGEVTLASGPWWTIHADLFFAWEPSELQRFVDQCLNARIDCKQNPR
jgi:uncharacterized protein DUF1996